MRLIPEFAVRVHRTGQPQVTPALSAAAYAQACQFVRDTMDLSSAIGMRLTNCIKVMLPKDAILMLKAGKNSKRADVDLSPVRGAAGATARAAARSSLCARPRFVSGRHPIRVTVIMVGMRKSAR